MSSDDHVYWWIVLFNWSVDFLFFSVAQLHFGNIKCAVDCGTVWFLIAVILKGFTFSNFPISCCVGSWWKWSTCTTTSFQTRCRDHFLFKAARTSEYLGKESMHPILSLIAWKKLFYMFKKNMPHFSSLLCFSLSALHCPQDACEVCKQVVAWYVYDQTA